MGKETLDSELLGALHLMSKNTVEGVIYHDFNNLGLMNSALDLVEKGLATREHHKTNPDRPEHPLHYKLTEKGIDYHNAIAQFAIDSSNNISR